jgi:hypothetical protein
MILCAVCDQEVRRGVRDGQMAWWHRDDKPDTSIVRDRRVGPDGRESHEPVLGQASFLTDWDAVERARLEYAVDENEQDDNRVFEVPPVQVQATVIEVGDPRLPRGASNIIKAVLKLDGQARATYSRAPRVHGSHGNYLGMSDYVLVKFRCEGRTGVARWADGSLDVAYLTDYDLESKMVTPTRVTAAALRAWLVKAERE